MLASSKPKTISDLDSIYGLGPKKIEDYGEQIIKLINN